MKLENWDVHQTESVVNEGSIITQVSVSTYDDIDAKKLIEWIKAYDPEFDLDEYKTLITAKEEDIKHHDFYRGRSPEQIKEICDGIYDRIHELVGRNIRSPQVNWEYRKLSVGIEILRSYGIWWTPSVAKEVEKHDSESVESNS